MPKEESNTMSLSAQTEPQELPDVPATQLLNTSSDDPNRQLTKAENTIIWVLLAAAFVAILNETTMGIALPKLAEEFNVSEMTAQWITSAFMLTMAVVIPMTGYVLQRFTTRQVFLAAITLFTLGTLLAFSAQLFEVLLFARVIQASGTAIMMPLLMTTLMNIIPANSRGRMMGRVSVVISLAPAIGPTMSGILIDALHWRWVFGVVLPIAIIALVIGAVWLKNVNEPKAASFDVLSVILAAFGFGGLVYGLSQITTLFGPVAVSPLPVFVSLGIGIIGLILFLWRQIALQKVDAALLDLRVFLSRDFSLSIAQMAVLSLAFFGVLIVFPIFLQTALHISPKDSGLVMLPGAIAMGILGPIIGRIYDAKGTRVLLIPGSMITVAVLWYYATLDTSTNIWLLVVAHTILSVGLALSFTPLFTAALAALPKRYYSHGSAVIGTVQQVAGAAGVAVMVAIFTVVMNEGGGNTVPDAVATGSRTAFMVGAILAIPTIIGAFLIKKPDEPEHEATN